MTDVAYITSRVSELIQDTGNTALTTAQALEWVNDAQRAVASIKPDAFSAIQSFQLVAGTLQSIPSTAHRLLGLVRNMGSDGATAGSPIRGPVPQEDLDSYESTWHTTTGTEIEEYTQDPSTPKSFYVYPAVAASPALYVEARLVLLPVLLVATTDAIQVSDVYAPALIEWVSYRYWSRDSEQTPNYARAARAFRAFFNILDTKMKVDMAINPKILENAN